MTDQIDLNHAVTISASIVSPFYYIQMIILLIQLYKIIKMKTLRKQFFILFYATLITVTLCSLIQVTVQIFKNKDDVQVNTIEQIVVNFCDTFKVLVFSIAILMLCYKWYELYLSYFCSVKTASKWIYKYKVIASIYVAISLTAYILSVIYTGVSNDFEGFNYNDDLIIPSSLVCFNLFVCILVSFFFSSKLNQTISNLEKELGTILKKKRFMICYYMIFTLNFLKIALLLTEILYYYFKGEPFKVSFLSSIGQIISYIVITEIMLNWLPVFLMVFFIIPYSSKSDKKSNEFVNQSNLNKINQSLLEQNKSTILVDSNIESQ